MGVKLCMALEDSERDKILEYLPSKELLTSLAEYFSAFSDGTRLKIISALTISKMCVSDISTLLNINQTTVSHQLKLLKGLRLVNCEREGKVIFYKVNCGSINEILDCGVREVI